MPQKSPYLCPSEPSVDNLGPPVAESNCRRIKSEYAMAASALARWVSGVSYQVSDFRYRSPIRDLALFGRSKQRSSFQVLDFRFSGDSIEYALAAFPKLAYHLLTET